MQYQESYLEQAHTASSGNKSQILASQQAGCFYCLKIFPAHTVTWFLAEHTAMCPRCTIDSVLGDASEFPITPEFLNQMRRYFFSKN